MSVGAPATGPGQTLLPVESEPSAHHSASTMPVKGSMFHEMLRRAGREFDATLAELELLRGLYEPRAHLEVDAIVSATHGLEQASSPLPSESASLDSPARRPIAVPLVPGSSGGSGRLAAGEQREIRAVGVVPDPSKSLTTADVGDSKMELVRARVENIQLGREWLETPENCTKAESLVHEDQEREFSRTFSFKPTYMERCEPLDWLILRPDSCLAMSWDLLGALLIMYDVFAIPLGVFPLPEEAWMGAMTIITMLFWTLNIFATPFIGYFKGGELIMDPYQVLMNYVQVSPQVGWIWLDVPIVLADWLIYLAVAGASGDGAVAMLRIVRLVRLSRLLRVGKLKRMAEIISDFIDSEYISIVANIVQMILALLFVNHIIACAWYGISMASRAVQSQGTWIDEHGFGDDEWRYQYIVAFHWSITQFTPSSMHVQPQNIIERAFAIGVIVFALVGFSYIVGSITASLARIRGMHEETAKQFWDLRQYLRKHHIPRDLSTEARRYIEKAWRRQLKTKAVKDVKIFALLSRDLRHKIEICQFRSHLLKHSFFKYLDGVCNSTLLGFVDAVDSRQYFDTEKVFSANEHAEHMYFISQGHLVYENRVTLEVYELLESEGWYWLAEQCLWMPWRHIGNLIPRNDCRLLLLNPTQFTKIVTATPRSYTIGMNYAKRFHEVLRGTSEISEIGGSRKDGTFREGLFQGVGLPFRTASPLMKARDV